MRWHEIDWIVIAVVAINMMNSNVRKVDEPVFREARVRARTIPSEEYFAVSLIQVQSQHTGVQAREKSRLAP